MINMSQVLLIPWMFAKELIHLISTLYLYATCIFNGEMLLER
jgi:hypothetical protein